MRTTVLCSLDKPHDATSCDGVALQVADALRQEGHAVSILGVHDDVSGMVAGLRRRQPEMVFNLVEEFAEVLHADAAVAGVLSAMQLRYTGGGPGELYIRQDKGFAKKLLAFDQILYPDFAVFSRDASLEARGNLHMPLIVKPLQSDASIGIGADAIVRDANELMKRVAMIHEKCHDAALVEEYIEGREFYVGILGNRDPLPLPPIEMDFSGLPADAPHILDSKAKWAKRSKEYRGTKAVVAEIPDDLKARLHKAALAAYRALRVRDYGRVDLRLTSSQEIYVIEVNANCYLEQAGEFAVAAQAAGWEYSKLIHRIVELAWERYEAIKPRAVRSKSNGASRRAKPAASAPAH